MKTSIFILLLSFTSLIQLNDNWKFEYEKDHIKVYTKENERSNFKAFKGEAILNASLSESSDIIMDPETYKAWCYRTTSTKTLEKEENSVYYYYISATPPVIKDREAYFKNTIIKDENSPIVKIVLSSFDPKKPVPKGFIRIPKSDGYWILNPIDDMKTSVLFVMDAEPGGIIPSWLANMVASESPFITIKKLQQKVFDTRR